MAQGNNQRKTRIAAAMATVLAGWLLLFPAKAPNLLVRLSYDLLQLVLPAYRHSDLVIIHIDEEAMQEFKPLPGQEWPRRHHARLVDRLTRDQARVVIFDIFFPGPSVLPSEDAELARALERNGRVVLAGGKDRIQGIVGYTAHPPFFETSAQGWGTPKLLPEPDGVGRRYEGGDDTIPSLVWSAARVAGAPVTQHPERRLEERWLNYYGSSQPFANPSMTLTYGQAERMKPDFFRNKAVLIGGQPEILSREDRPDIFRTPFTRWNTFLTPGVDLTAIAYANLVHGDSLYRTGFWTEFAVLLVVGLVTGFAFQRLRRRAVAWYIFVLVVLIIGVVLKLLFTYHLWFPWLIILFAQVPCALVFRLAARQQTVAAPLAGETQLESKPTTQGNEIGEHTLMRCVGEGAYGQVWVGRNAIGLYHAVKIIYRNRFSVEAPYERALRGIQKFMPISRSHEGFVHILHVGRNDAAGHFFYIMEAGDDEKTGQKIDPATYVPKTLASELRNRGAIPPWECLQLLLSLTDAADRLHQHQLIHRDIKPANIIFVNHRPKLADIDLVTDLAAAGEVSRIGTEGYLAPEGPGTAAADVFSLGRILYVSMTGKRPDFCPELPTDISQRPDCDLFLKLIQIACKACESDLTRRYSSALLMRTDLLHVASQQTSSPTASASQGPERMEHSDG